MQRQKLRNMNNIEVTNLTLIRARYYLDCTLGVLLDEHNHLICQTMEPPCDGVGSRIAQPDGTYPLCYQYDDKANHHCARLCKTKGRTKVRMSYHELEDAKPSIVGADILVGSHVDESNRCLTGGRKAFETVDAIMRECRSTNKKCYIKIVSLNSGAVANTQFGKAADAEFDDEECLTN